jgi:hypothetical protein
MSQEKIDCLVNILLSSIIGITGLGSFVDGFEQVLRIILLIVSITSGVMLIMINWDKWILKVKKIFRK